MLTTTGSRGAQVLEGRIRSGLETSIGVLLMQRPRKVHGLGRTGNLGRHILFLQGATWARDEPLAPTKPRQTATNSRGETNGGEEE